MLFAENQQQTGGRIHYVLFNPWAVRSNEALNSFDSPLMKLLARAIYAIVGVSVEKAIAPITTPRCQRSSRPNPSISL